MRIYKNINDAMGEIKRDLAEMGIRVYPATYQNKDIKNNPNFETLEIQNYIYTIFHPQLSDFKHDIWADAEFHERIRNQIGGEVIVNPGEAYKLRPEVWEQFLNENGQFDYTYCERMSQFNALDRIIDRIKTDKDSRQLFLSIWQPSDIEKIGGKARIPCSLGYLFQVRGGELHMTYLMRSCDFATHFDNDIYLANRLLDLVARHTGYPVGNFTHWIASLHIYKKDIEGVF